MTSDEIIRLMEKAKELNVTELELEGMKIRFHYKKKLSRFSKKKGMILPETKTDDLMRFESALDQMSEEEIKYYATPYYDELQAMKEAQANKSIEES